MDTLSFTHEGRDYEITAPGKNYSVVRDGETVTDCSGLSAWDEANGWIWRDVCHLKGGALTSAQRAHLKRLALAEAAAFDQFQDDAD